MTRGQDWAWREKKKESDVRPYTPLVLLEINNPDLQNWTSQRDFPFFPLLKPSQCSFFMRSINPLKNWRSISSTSTISIRETWSGRHYQKRREHSSPSREWDGTWTLKVCEKSLPSDPAPCCPGMARKGRSCPWFWASYSPPVLDRTAQRI